MPLVEKKKWRFVVNNGSGIKIYFFDKKLEAQSTGGEKGVSFPAPAPPSLFYSFLIPNYGESSSVARS